MFYRHQFVLIGEEVSSWRTLLSASMLEAQAFKAPPPFLQNSKHKYLPMPLEF